MSKNNPNNSPPGSDESLYFMMKSSHFYRGTGNDWEASMKEDAFANVTQPIEHRRLNSGNLLRSTGIASLIVFLIVIASQFVPTPQVVIHPTDTEVIK